MDNETQPEIDAPTSSDVGKQTLTKADLGYDVTTEGVPDDSVALESPRHPDDPSGKADEPKPKRERKDES